MKLTCVEVQNFRSIESSGEVPIDPFVTVLVGQNESGKTAFLQAMNKARSVGENAEFEVVEDYPRRWLNDYLESHDIDPSEVVVLTFELEANDLEAINEFAGFALVESLSFKLTYSYDNSASVTLDIPEQSYVTHLMENTQVSTDVRTEVATAETVAELLITLRELSLNESDQRFLDGLEEIFSDQVRWPGRILNQYIYDRIISSRTPKFFYFDDYYLLPGKINLSDLSQRITGAQNKTLRDEDQSALRLLQLAGVSLDSLLSGSGYESNRARLESTGNSITDKLLEFWKQNPELEVEFDVKSDPNDEPPFSQGENLYIRIKNRRHRVTVPFSQRSKGFIWFFSFIAWFDSIQKQASKNDTLILLLDEPGLSLHALAQQDFLDYITHLSEHHQIVYTTHSPFMVQNDRLHQARMVEDKAGEGTRVSDNVSGSDDATVFPLQASLGYTIAQNLFIGKRNLLVEGISDLVYLQYFSNVLEEMGRVGLREDVVIAPVGGLDKLATFVALIGANQLELVVLSDYAGHPDQRIDSLIQEKLIHRRNVLTYADFRARQDGSLVATDIEDMFTPATYLGLFSATYDDKLLGTPVKEHDLHPGDRIVRRIEQHLKQNNILVRSSGGYNHHLVANHLATHPLAKSKLANRTLDGFEELFKKINKLYTSVD